MMDKRWWNRIIQRAAVALTVLVAAATVSGGSQPAAASHEDWPTTGVICTTDPTATFSLTTMEGHITLPDGNSVHMWGFSESGQPFQHPSPVLCVNEGDTVTVVLHNTLSEPVSIVFPGQENVLANGRPAQPQFDDGGDLVSLTDAAPAGGTVTYSFVADRPGTYLYQSGTDPALQVNMGLFGAMIVRPSMGAEYAYDSASTKFNPYTEYVMVLSEIDPALHMAVEQGQPFNMSNYTPRYWLINGRSFPDTIAPNGATWLPYQPYSSLVHIHPYNDVDVGLPAYNPDPALIRYLSVGSEDYPHHPHGNHELVIGRDGNLLAGPLGEDTSYEKFTVIIGPGQTMDALFQWEDVEKWEPINNPIPVTIPQLQNLTFGTFYSGSPYLGNLDTLPVGTQALNQCGEYYHIAHNHALHQITAWGVVLSGHITFSRIDPPLPNECP
ncbi:MAG: multicopper oxidase domain-containing protein [Chloroflexi bacterium]|nr:multicopper oxidase domain-containing protein [Chloroflexota bacterium]